MIERALRRIAFTKGVVDGQRIVRVTLTKHVLVDWCAAIGMLGDSAADKVTLTTKGESGTNSLSLTRAKTDNALAESPTATTFSLTEQAIEYILAYSKRYLRDGIAEVDHIDIEADDGSYLTIFAEDFAPPLSASEVARRLGD